MVVSLSTKQALPATVLQQSSAIGDLSSFPLGERKPNMKGFIFEKRKRKKESIFNQNIFILGLV